MPSWSSLGGSIVGEAAGDISGYSIKEKDEEKRVVAHLDSIVNVCHNTNILPTGSFHHREITSTS